MFQPALLHCKGVYFNAHRSRDGCWAAAEQLERTPQGRLKAYVALHGHGTYPTVSRLSTAQHTDLPPHFMPVTMQQYKGGRVEVLLALPLLTIACRHRALALFPGYRLPRDGSSLHAQCMDVPPCTLRHPAET